MSLFIAALELLKNKIYDTFIIAGMVIAYAKGAYMAWRMVAWLGIIYTIGKLRILCHSCDLSV